METNTPLSISHTFYAQTYNDLDEHSNPIWYSILLPFRTIKGASDYIDLHKQGTYNGKSRANNPYRIVQSETILTVVEL